MHTQHVLYKAKMPLTVLNKPLNQFCQMEESKKKEWRERRKRFPSQARCLQNVYCFSKWKPRIQVSSPRSCKRLTLHSYLQFLNKFVWACVHACICVKYVCERQILGEKATERWKQGTIEEKTMGKKRRNYILCFILMKCKSNSLMKAAVIAQTVLLCDNHT